MLSSIFVFSSLVLSASNVLAHIQMVYPPPINSVYNSQTPEASKDYSMTSPLLADGSNYPCKGYNNDFSEYDPVATLSAGSSVDVKLAGTATHGGGSCQFSVSYDEGKTFAVIYSIIGGCPLSLEYSVPLPSDLPASSKALFAWSWFNKIGNREEYMNCAIVKISGDSSSFTGPGLFRANTLGDECVTTENVDIVFPNPGKYVAYGDSMSSSSAATSLSDCSYDEDTTVTVKASGSSSSSSKVSSAKASTSTRSSSARASTSTRSSSAKASSSKASSTKAFSSFKTSTTAKATTSKASSKTTIKKTKTKTASSTHTKAASVTPGPASSAAAVSSSASVSSVLSSLSSVVDTTSAYIKCTSLTTFSLCDGSTCTAMGNVADGTECRDGAIGFATKQRLFKHFKLRRGLTAGH